jgi:GNAT superfamily N-acetyltransferase
MDRTLPLQQVTCRHILERDLGDIREFCKTIWDGHDYVPDVMDDWFHDRRGLFAVADYEGRAIGCSKLTLLARGQWWLEGFRVDPSYQGKKVGSLLHHYVDRWWLEHGGGVLRLMTSAKNRSVHHLCENTGYTNLFEVRGYKAESLAEPVESFSPAAPTDQELEKMVAFASRSPSLALTNRVVDFGWRFADPTRSGALAELSLLSPSLEGNFFWWRRDKGLLVLWEDFDPDEDQHAMGIGVLACALEDIAEFLRDVRRLAAAHGKTSVFWVAPVYDQAELALEQAGYASDWENTAYVFEKKQP